MVADDMPDRLRGRARVHALCEHDHQVDGIAEIGSLHRGHLNTPVTLVILDPQPVTGDRRQPGLIDVHKHDGAAALGDAAGEIPAHGAGPDHGDHQLGCPGAGL